MGVAGAFGSGEGSLISPREAARGGVSGSSDSSSNSNLATGESLKKSNLLSEHGDNFGKQN